MDPVFNLQTLSASIPDRVLLVVVSKTQPAEAIRILYEAGHRHFGENKVQELLAKQRVLPEDIVWHFIGHLQRNKVRNLVPFVGIIESIDSQRLLEEVNSEARKAGRVVDVLLQFHIASEETKFGLDRDEAFSILEPSIYRSFRNVRIRGVMGMATFTEDQTQVSREFENLVSIYKELKKKYFFQDAAFSEISMGMSGDYRLAIESGSTMVRIGTAVFGPRIHPYNTTMK